MWIMRWRGAASGVGWQFRIVGSVHFSLVPRIKSLRISNKSGLWPKVNGWLGEHKVVLDKSGCRAYRVDVDWGLKFVCVADLVVRKTQGQIKGRRSETALSGSAEADTGLQFVAGNIDLSGKVQLSLIIF